jgi:transcriptional regulator with XRE-family HTH domain
MNGATTIQERLKDLRLNKGLKLEELAEQTGISKSALGSYEKDDYKEINHGNLILLADFYGVSLDYLFCRTENRAEINTPLRELHLSDEMVALLKSGRINNRLLCELATHKDFIKFLADIEIYVDGIATMTISVRLNDSQYFRLLRNVFFHMDHIFPDGIQIHFRPYPLIGL